MLEIQLATPFLKMCIVSPGQVQAQIEKGRWNLGNVQGGAENCTEEGSSPLPDPLSSNRGERGRRAVTLKSKSVQMEEGRPILLSSKSESEEGSESYPPPDVKIEQDDDRTSCCWNQGVEHVSYFITDFAVGSLHSHDMSYSYSVSLLRLLMVKSGSRKFVVLR